jgi:sugar lactone lactonase YvrE
MYVVDMLVGVVVDVTDPDRPIRHDLDSKVAAVIRPRTSGGLLIAREHDVRLYDADFTVERTLATLTADPAIKLNEGGCDPVGRFFIGSMAYDFTPGAGSLYRIDPDGTATVVLANVTISNGLQWSLDGSKAYYIDTPTRRVDVFDYDVVDGSLHNRRMFADLDGFVGSPDGMTIDADGGLWVASWGDGRVRRLDGDSGAISEEIVVPDISNVSACAFGGRDFDTLYLTTSRQLLPNDEVEPLAGTVFAVRPGVRGVPLPTFGS